jgi:hypothetical protein
VYWELPLPEDLRQGLPPAGLRSLHFVRVRVAGSAAPPRRFKSPAPREARPLQRTTETILVTVLIVVLAVIGLLFAFHVIG